MDDTTPLNIRSGAGTEFDPPIAAIPITACDVFDAAPAPVTQQDGSLLWRQIAGQPRLGGELPPEGAVITVERALLR